MRRLVFEYMTMKGYIPFYDFYCRLSKKFRKLIYTQVEMLGRGDCELEPPLVYAVDIEKYKGLYELRTSSGQKTTIIIFSVDAEGDIILLHGIIKKDERATIEALEIAMERQIELDNRKALVNYDYPT